MEFFKDTCKMNNILLLTKEEFFNCESVSKIFNSAKTYAGFTTKISKKDLIVYDNKLEDMEVKHTLAHELGHTVLCHLESRRTLKGKETEDEANMFAAVLLAIMLYDEWKEQKKCPNVTDQSTQKG